MKRKKISLCTAAIVLAAGMSVNAAVQAETDWDWLSEDFSIADLGCRGDLNNDKKLDASES